MTAIIIFLISPSLKVFNSKLNYVYQTESEVMKYYNKKQALNAKWRKYVGSLDIELFLSFLHFPFLVCTFHFGLIGP